MRDILATERAQLERHFIMQDLKVIGVENGSLLAANDEGERYRIEIDEVFASRLRLGRTELDPSTPKPSPREIQAHIRAGMSAEDVAEITGAPIEYIQRFEGPIVAEREHTVVMALSVPVHTASDVDPTAEGTPFGQVLRERLVSLGAAGERWASWKEPEAGWILKLEFTADGIDHDARWAYDLRKHSLNPLNAEATTLSQQGELHGGLIPRLRAVAPHAGDPDESRFDSGAFAFNDPAAEILAPDVPPVADAGTGRHITAVGNPIAIQAIKRSDEKRSDGHQTADLLEALRRRRGERKPVHGLEDGSAARSHEPDMRVVEVPLADFDTIDEATRERSSIPGLTGRARETPPADPAPTSADQNRRDTGSVPGSSRSGKKGRASMPSWDEIVFGARTDDDLA
jgi:hypothetical protein